MMNHARMGHVWLLHAVNGKGERWGGFYPHNALNAWSQYCAL